MNATALRGFLDAVAADWDDDTPRLIMADFLEESGEVKLAEFIRVSCAYARRRGRPKAGDPPDHLNMRYCALRKRCQELAKEVVPVCFWADVASHTRHDAGAAWLPHAPLVSRGFLTHNWNTRAPGHLLPRENRLRVNDRVVSDLEFEYWLTGCRLVVDHNATVEQLSVPELSRPRAVRVSTFAYRPTYAANPTKAARRLDDLIDWVAAAPWLAWVKELSLRNQGELTRNVWSAKSLLAACGARCRRLKRLTIPQVHLGLSAPARPERIAGGAPWPYLDGPGYGTLESISHVVFSRLHLSHLMRASYLPARFKWRMLRNFDARNPGGAQLDFLSEDVAARPKEYKEALGLTHAWPRVSSSAASVLWHLTIKPGAVAKLFPPKRRPQ